MKRLVTVGPGKDSARSPCQEGLTGVRQGHLANPPGGTRAASASGPTALGGSSSGTRAGPSGPSQMLPQGEEWSPVQQKPAGREQKDLSFLKSSPSHSDTARLYTKFCNGKQP